MKQKENNNITRKDFLKKSLAVGASLTFSGFIFPGCGSGGASGGGSDYPPEVKHYISFEAAFSKQMDIETVENALNVVPVEASFSDLIFEWSENNTVMYCKLPCDSSGKTYTVTIGETAVDAVGLALDGNSDGTAGDPYTFSITSV